MQEQTDGLYETSLESTKAIDWATKEFVYIDPQIEELLGWSPASWKTAQDWIDRIHPDFQEAMVGF